MKNKNGFIATGLIYSFFLIFLTLFLTIITKNIKNKVSLNYVEDEIKSNLNANKSIRNFKVGDLIHFVDSCDSFDGAFEAEKAYVVASVVINTNSTINSLNNVCGSGVKECLVLYSFGLDLDNSNALQFSDLEKDISTGYKNDTYINKIVYTFDTDESTGGKYYKFKDEYYAELGVYDTDEDVCVLADSLLCNEYGKITNDLSDGKYRRRIVKNFTDNKVKNCNLKDGMGVIYVEGSV